MMLLSLLSLAATVLLLAAAICGYRALRAYVENADGLVGVYAREDDEFDE